MTVAVAARGGAAWVDAQYNNRALVPEATDLMAGWTRDSTRARQTLDGAQDLCFDAASGLCLDVFAPARRRRAGAPVLLFIHGGYWRALDKADHSFIAPPFVQAGAVVVVPNYTLCPAIGVDGIALQMAQAVAWTWRQVHRWGGDRTRIVVAGHSAGGHLAAMLLCCDWPVLSPDLPPGLLRQALSISGLFDLAPLRRVSWLQPDLRLTPALVRRLSPVRFPAPSGELVCVAGGAESQEFRRQNRLLHRRWGTATVPVCEALDGLNHFSILRTLAQPGQRLHALALRQLGLPDRQGDETLARHSLTIVNDPGIA